MPRQKRELEAVICGSAAQGRREGKKSWHILSIGFTWLLQEKYFTSILDVAMVVGAIIGVVIVVARRTRDDNDNDDGINEIFTDLGLVQVLTMHLDPPLEPV